jgi:hypothetical protein
MRENNSIASLKYWNVAMKRTYSDPNEHECNMNETLHSNEVRKLTSKKPALFTKLYSK